MSMNATLDEICRTLLHFGLLSLRDAAYAGDIDRCKAETEHLHNLPSLIGETNLRRHLYYLQCERGEYLRWLRGRVVLRESVDALLGPLWDQMAGVLLEAFPELKDKRESTDT
jgi:hypothetical protein